MEKLDKIVKKIPWERIRPFITDVPVPVKIDVADIINIIIISIVSYFIRFRTFQYPNCVVFDEIHFGNFTNFYINRQFFFDIHPPLAKFLIASISGLAEYPGDIPFADLYGNEYPDENYISIRITPILFSSMVPAMIYLTVRLASFSKIAAFISASFATFETTMLCEGKFILTDGILHFFTGFGMVVMNFWLSLPNNHPRKTVWRFLSCIAISCAFSCKNTALSLCFIIGYDQLCELLLKFNFDFLNEAFYRAFCWRIFEVAGTAFAFHLFLWYLHFCRIPFVGPDTSASDQKGYNLYNLSNLSTINWKGMYVPPVTGRVLGTIMSIQLSNAMNYKPHPYMSRPIDWPLLTDVWVGFWSRGNTQVNCVGNVFNFYLAFLGVIVCTFSFKNKKWTKIVRFVIGYWFSYLPFFGVPRTMFLYHYIIPLMFGMICFGIAVDLYVPSYWKGFIAVIVICLSAFGYFVFSPLVYSDNLSDPNARIWNKAWVYGRKGREKWVEYMERKAAEIDNITRPE